VKGFCSRDVVGAKLRRCASTFFHSTIFHHIEERIIQEKKRREYSLLRVALPGDERTIVFIAFPGSGNFLQQLTAAPPVLSHRIKMLLTVHL